MEDRYRQKYYDLQQYMLSVIQENVALADEVLIAKRNVLSIREENRILLRQVREAAENFKKKNCYIPLAGRRNLKFPLKKKNSMKLITERRRCPKNKLVKSGGQSSSGLRVNKIRKVYKKRKPIETIQLQHDVCGQVIFPITLKDFEIHSLGEIIHEKPTFHTEDLLYPVGFCSTHVYGSVKNPEMKCIYTCKISDGGHFPRFEISSDGEDGTCFVGSTPNECHSQLIAAINGLYDKPFLIDDLNRGADFFGLSHPTIHELILSLPGVDFCSKYNTKHFVERNKLLHKDPILKQLVDATINFDSLLKILPTNVKDENSDD